MSDSLRQLLMEGAAELGLPLSDTIADSLLEYMHILRQWNERLNLTAITDPEAMVRLHLLDSLAIAKVLIGPRLLDVGTGAGLPGIPLALIYPQWSFVLLDSNSKKTAFLLQMKATLGLKNVEVVHSRMENYVSPLLFSDIMARAVSDLRDIVDKTRALLQKNGQWVLMKGQYPEQELLALQRPFSVQSLSIPGVDVNRHVVVIKGENGG